MTTTTDQTVDCPHRVNCGACSLLGRPYSAQLESKRRLLGETLEKKIRIDTSQVLSTLASPQIEGYRSRAKMTISSDRDRYWSLGYFQRGKREVVDAVHCGVLVPELLETTVQLRGLLNKSTKIPFNLRHIDLRCGSDPKEQHLTLIIKSETLPNLPYETIAEACPHIKGIAVNLNPSTSAQIIKGRIDPILGVREVYVNSAGLSLRVSPGSFFQVNLSILPEIHSRMAAFLGDGDLLVDLYAGVGTHGLALRQNFRRVLCIEGVRASVADAKASIKVGRIDNVTVLASPVLRSLRRLSSEQPRAVILNPARAGADPRALETIIRSSARKLAYLSCDPVTLANDLAVLIKGRFKLATVQAVDMMPQTNQVESLAFLQR